MIDPERAREGRPINYGAAAGWAHARIAAMTKDDPAPNLAWFFSHFKDRQWQDTLADDDQLVEHRADHRRFLDRSILFPGGVIASDGGKWTVDGKPVADGFCLREWVRKG